MYRANRLLGLTVLLGGACDWDLQRMVNQERCSPMQGSAFFRNGSCNQEPPEGSVRFGEAYSLSSSLQGESGAKPPTRAPVKPSRSQLSHARQHFETFCAPCHGLLADGQTEVAENMRYRKPPSLLEPSIRALPDAQIFTVITEGYGFMPSYAHALTQTERWAVVAYLRALQLSQAIELARLPEDVRREAQPWLR